jgi:hypothetical protein
MQRGSRPWSSALVNCGSDLPSCLALASEPWASRVAAGYTLMAASIGDQVNGIAVPVYLLSVCSRSHQVSLWGLRFDRP